MRMPGVPKGALGPAVSAPTPGLTIRMSCRLRASSPPVRERPEGPPAFSSPETTGGWKVELPDWCRDQRNQMTGPADDADLVVKMLNSGAPGVMLDLEDSMANQWEHLNHGVDNIVKALRGELRYFDKKRN